MTRSLRSNSSWITYYGAALAALKRRHIGFGQCASVDPDALPNVHAVVLAEAIIIGFFVLLAWTGWQVLQVVLEGDISGVSHLGSHSVHPIGHSDRRRLVHHLPTAQPAGILARMTANGRHPIEHAEIEEEVEPSLKWRMRRAR